MTQPFAPLFKDIDRIPRSCRYGRVASVSGLITEVGGLRRDLAVGAQCKVTARDGRDVLCEVTGFRDDRALAMPFQSLEGIGLGCRVEPLEGRSACRPSAAWLGRVVDAMGRPIDGKGLIAEGNDVYALRGAPQLAASRSRVGEKLDLGIRALNTFVTCCRGQRLGIFAASGVGKSIMLSMLARFTAADVNVIGLIGERGREVKEFIQDNLGEEGLARSVVVVATSDESPLLRRRAAYLTLALAEYFRDRGDHVLCLIDSLTRVAQAQREIGLANGEPPASKGYTPSVFAELPRLTERAGPGFGNGGAITGLFTVLVEGDDHDEPVADALRSTLDGHIVLERRIAERGRFPAINVLRSVSRTMPDCHGEQENALILRARRLLSVYEDMEDLIRLGAYRVGSNPEVDEAMRHYPQLERYLAQDKNERSDLAQGFAELAMILGGEPET